MLRRATTTVRERLARPLPAARASPRTSTTCSSDPTLDAVVLATPVPTHADARRPRPRGGQALLRREAARAVGRRRRARRRGGAPRAGRVLMVGHLLQYHPGVNKLKEIADSGELGDIHYIYGNRLNLGQLRADENALWSLGAHDVSVLLHLADEEPYELAARGESYMREGIEDVVFAFMRFPSGRRRAPAPLVAGPAQGAALHGRRVAADGDVRRHGPRAEGHRVRQGLRREGRHLRRVHHALGRHLVAARAERRAAAPRVRALPRVRPRGARADLRRRERPARRARPRGPAAVARRDPPRPASPASGA